MIPAYNYFQKIVRKYLAEDSKNTDIVSGQFVTIIPEFVMTHDNTSAVIPKFKEFKTGKVFDNKQIIFTIDHDIQNKSKKNLAKYETIKKFAKKHGIKQYPAGRGIGHQIMCEEGHARPGAFVVAADSHANMYGGIGCLGTPIVRTDAAAIWATGRMWWKIPEIVNVEFVGTLKKGVTGKDVIIALCGYFNHDEVLNVALEFTGQGIARLSISERFTIANMTTEWGALVALFPVDQEVVDYFGRDISLFDEGLKADKGCTYTKKITLDLSSVQPYIAGPNSVKRMTALTEIQNKKIKINKAFLVSCVNSRTQDLAVAADILDGHKIHPDVKFYLAAASSKVKEESKKRGDWQKIIKAGAIALPSGCGPCIGLGEGILNQGEVCISATNRNFKGRMGSRDAVAYLSSPSIVAFSALKGYIAGPIRYKSKPLVAEIVEYKKEITHHKKAVELVSHFPREITAKILFCNSDNINTDGIYPGKYTYNDSLTDEEKAHVVMENYDPAFKNAVQRGDIVVGGYNFGTGSSREQAATVFKLNGIQMIIAGSFSQTYIRNALNNGILTIESPAFVSYVRKKYQSAQLTLRLDKSLTIKFTKNSIEFEDKNFQFSPLYRIAQELFVKDGLKNYLLSSC
ncbi:MAG: aconitase/3-isopropylmalate dehydratase large subunit family protein [Candidatus Roizmanbacteria bacterium]|nr:aconitase/3-isopropylmalate dehydratase large subunit family protein [Candidatus Roizmanbacteria bacterium]